MVSKQEDIRKRIYNFYLANRSQGKKFTVDHFRAEKLAPSTIYSIIERAENNTGHQRVPGSGRVAKKMSKRNINNLKKMFNDKDGVSQTQAARKFNCSQQYISKTLKTKTTIRVYKKKMIPKRSDEQINKVTTRVDRLYRQLQKKSCIVDDECYFTLAHSTINGNDNFYSSNAAQSPPSVKYQEKAKFEQKILLWICASEKGLSKPYFVPSGLAVNQNTYLEKCVKKRLVPFIEEHHSDGEYLFWPDQASSHYAKKVIEYFRENGIKFVEKEDNPPNLPECRPIEDFWSILKGKVYENNWQAKDLAQLRSRIERCLKKIDFELVTRLFSSTRVRLSRVRRNGVQQKY